MSNSFKNFIFRVIFIAYAIISVFATYKTAVEDRYSKVDVYLSLMFPPFTLIVAHDEFKRSFFALEFDFDYEYQRDISQLVDEVDTSYKDYADHVRGLIGMSTLLMNSKGAEYNEKINNSKHFFNHFSKLDNEEFLNIAKGAIIYARLEEESGRKLTYLVDEFSKGNKVNQDNIYTAEYSKAYSFLKKGGVFSVENDPKINIDKVLSAMKNSSDPRVNTLISFYSGFLNSFSEKNSENFRVELNATISKIINK